MNFYLAHFSKTSDNKLQLNISITDFFYRFFLQNAERDLSYDDGRKNMKVFHAASMYACLLLTKLVNTCNISTGGKNTLFAKFSQKNYKILQENTLFGTNTILVRFVKFG